MNFYKYIIPLLIFLFAYPVSASWTFSDNFDDCSVADWTISGGSWTCQSNWSDGTNYVKQYGVDGVNSITKTGLSSVDAYWQWEFSVDHYQAQSYHTFYFDSDATLSHYLRVRGDLIEGTGFSYSKASYLNTRYRITVQKAGGNYIIKRYYVDNNTLIDTTTTAINVPVVPDRISFVNYRYNSFYFANTSIDNVYVSPEYPGVGYIIAPETVILNTAASIYFNYSDTDGFSYSVDVYDPYNTLTSIPLGGLGYDGNVSYDTVGKTGGVYSVYLVSTNIVSGVKYYLAYDSMTVQSVVNIYGYTRDAILGSVVPNASVNFTQSGSWFNTTSDGTGYYNLSGMVSSYPIIVNASKTGYIHLDYTYTPTYDYNYSVDLYLWNTTYHAGDTGIEGLVVKSPFKTIVSGATVNLWNTTQSWTLTSDLNGYFSQILYNMSDTITANASKSGFTTPSNVNVSITNLSWSQIFLNLTPQYTLTIRAKDSVSDGYLSSFNTVIDDGTTVISNTTTTGIVTNVLSENVYFVTVSAEGYYGSGNYYLLTSDRTIEVSLTPYPGATTNSNTVVKVLPHDVKFIVQDVFGTTYSGINVSVQGYNTTVGVWQTLASLLGLDFGTTPINNETMYGLTGADGSVVFKMSEVINYHVTTTGTTPTISTWLYPKDDLYYLVVSAPDTTWNDYSTPMSTGIITNVTKGTFNASSAWINATYNDTLAQTTSLIIYVNQSNSTTGNLNQTTISSWTCPSSCNVTSHNFTISPYDGQSYIVNIRFIHSTYGTNVKSYAVIFPKTVSATGIPSIAFLMAAILIMVFVGAVFTYSTSELGLIITCGLGWIFWLIGWFNASDPSKIAIGLTLATFVAIVAYMAKQSEKGRYT